MKIKSEVIIKRIKDCFWYDSTVAKQVGISRQGLSYLLKHGSCMDETAEKLCKVLDLKIKDIERE